MDNSENNLHDLEHGFSQLPDLLILSNRAVRCSSNSVGLIQGVAGSIPGLYMG
jgi:hypothetical protein